MRVLGIGCLLLTACSADTIDLAGLDRDAGVTSIADSGVADSGIADSGIGDAGSTPIADSGTPLPPDCVRGWVDLVHLENDRALSGLSFSAGPDHSAITWRDSSNFDAVSIAFFDADGRASARPLELLNAEDGAPSPKVLAFEHNGFDPTSWVSFSGHTIEFWSASGGMVYSNPLTLPFEPFQAFGELIMGRQRVSPIEDELAIMRLDHGTPIVTGLGFNPAGAFVAFGPDRVLVERENQFMQPGGVALYQIDGASLRMIADHNLPEVVSGNEVIRGEQIAAARWNAREDRFEMLVGVRLGSTRDFGVRLMYLDDRGLSDGPALHDDELFIAGYEGIEGDMAIGENATAIAYGSPYSASEMRFDLVYADRVEHIEIDGAAYRTPPIIQKIAGGFSFMYAEGALSTADWENTIRMRCDIPD